MKIIKLPQWGRVKLSLAFQFVSVFVLLGTLNGFAGNYVPESQTSFGTQQQKRTVSGTVSDANGEAVIGANVMEKGTTNGTVTDIDGSFTLNVEADAILQISYIGYLTQEVNTTGRTSFDIVLQEDTKMLAEVVVIGYGSLDKRQVTSAITSLKGEDMMVGVGGADITTALQGKIGGLVMNNLGSANSGTTIQLRGMTSINAGKSPLIVIDGFPGGDIRSLTQEDILSIDVLKDASAGAIYGTRAASGVILITTKSG
ncbi:MAG: carboxypeptidase-like regulatory domain-containing protein, partial [Proteiniphilum sp.]|uniref:carboxypeptidase-like regulatory domain-containing protein n=1 Tax=Proteiniphilum sp. TaxID=1926877 RepID=UPI002ABCCD5E